MKREAEIWARDWDYVDDESGLAVAIHSRSGRVIALAVPARVVADAISQLGLRGVSMSEARLQVELRETGP